MKKVFLSLSVLLFSYSSYAVSVIVKGDVEVVSMVGSTWTLKCVDSESDCLVITKYDDGSWKLEICTTRETGTIVPNSLIENPEDGVNVVLEAEMD